MTLSRSAATSLAVMVSLLLSAAGSVHGATFGVGTDANSTVEHVTAPVDFAFADARYDWMVLDFSDGGHVPFGTPKQPAGSTVTYSGTLGGPGQTSSGDVVEVDWGGASGTASAAADLAQGSLGASVGSGDASVYSYTSNGVFPRGLPGGDNWAA